MLTRVGLIGAGLVLAEAFVLPANPSKASALRAATSPLMRKEEAGGGLLDALPALPQLELPSFDALPALPELELPSLDALPSLPLPGVGFDVLAPAKKALSPVPLAVYTPFYLVMLYLFSTSVAPTIVDYVQQAVGTQ